MKIGMIELNLTKFLQLGLKKLKEMNFQDFLGTLRGNLDFFKLNIRSKKPAKIK
jgi:hypothetical protein